MKGMRYIPLLFALALAFQASAEEKRNTSISNLQVYLTAHEVTIDAKGAEKIGFDWLLSSKPPKQKFVRSLAKGFDSRKELFARLRAPAEQFSHRIIDRKLLLQGKN